eukprot:scaffold10082_cov115-Isochrysis_galbana.AAC.8
MESAANLRNPTPARTCQTRATLSASGAIGARLRAVAVTATVQQGCNPEGELHSRRQKTSAIQQGTHTFGLWPGERHTSGERWVRENTRVVRVMGVYREPNVPRLDDLAGLGH